MKKGFTLIELLAVIVILAIIALITIPTITGIVEKARKGGAESSALGWIDAVEKQSIVNELSSSNQIDLNNRYNVSELISKGVKVKGQTPSSGYVALSNGKVSSSTLCIGNYKVVVEDNKIKSSTKENNCKVDSIYPTVVYSRVNAGTHVGYPIDANIDMGNKYVNTSIITIGSTNINIDTPFNSEEEYHNDYVSSCYLKNFTTPNLDYKISPDSSWLYYLKYTLNTNGIIDKIDLCGKHDGQEFCLERNVNGSKYNQNKESLINIFGSDSCSSYGTSFDCEDDHVHVTAYDDGNLYVFTAGTEEGCRVFGGGASECFLGL